ncbi:hypothetical protein [Acinetobacter sp. ASP199]|uniref:hypothetical protein n=1 Tax=unclassified Acinetobacter TaxID=196816 RepID=UPI001F6010ED|nr:hypothetical protein [Acinetobacter sp. ASP199]UNT58725.1 hypothetical protein IHE35_11510 [Acinetobacter sp. ASP199]
MSDQNTPENSPWGWRALIIFCIIGGIFMFIFWLAVSNEPDYMPSQQKKQDTQQHAFKNAPTMSEEAIAKAQADREARAAAQQDPASQATTAEEHHMSADEHANMDTEHAANSAHGH